MNPTPRQLALTALAAALILSTSCSSTPPPEAAQQSNILHENPDGAMVVETVTITGTVKSVDAASRQFTLQFPDDKTKTFHAPAKAVNFDKIKDGDVVKVTVTEEFVLTLRKVGTPASVGEVSTVAVAPKEGMPGDLLANTFEVTATVTEVDTQSRSVGLRFADGSTRKIRVGRLVNLDAVKAEDAVQTVMAESLALSVEAP